MYPGTAAALAPDRPAMVVAETGETRTYAELDEQSARLATLLRTEGLGPGDTVVVVLGNDVRWGEICWACWRSGLYLGAVNRHLTASELVPVLADAAPRAIVTSRDLLPTLRAAAADLADDVLWLVVDDGYDARLADTPRDPALVETAGGRLLFSSGTTGRPKPFRVPPRDLHPDELPVRSAGLMRSLEFDDTGNVLLVPGPAYHAGPLGFLQSVHQLLGTVVLMQRFDPEAALAAIERYRVTHSQWVPTMFVRLLRLPAQVRERYDLSSHRVAVHAAAPCPPQVKRAMLDWWGPIVHEYYGASEGHGRTTIGPYEWLARPGSVGRSVESTIHVADDAGRLLPPGEIGTVWFAKPGAALPARADDGTADLAATPGWGAVGDLGYLEDDGYLYLTGRAGQTIITGGVNVYPREVEDVLVGHPAVADVAVLGVPDAEFGEQVKALVVAEGVEPGPALADELISWCRDRLAHFKCPRSVDFADALPRSDAGKIRLAELRERYRPAEVTDGAPASRDPDAGGAGDR
ncbi:AMP-binding protein [Pseudonocardia dioxanivorans]|uniref:AMP-binding protein n=1 Tax=Pseudonocardia dioxanivorans TaxID=240495 RepID=UPI000CCFD74A|nr:AMP-binding protein [Pseudonocardia dioxanivorans]